MQSNATMRIENAAELGSLLATRNGAVVADLLSLARRLHRNAERSCNGDLLRCSECKGEGYLGPEYDKCPKCKGHGTPAEMRDAEALEKMQKRLPGFRLYHQTDPRGWPLYLIPEKYPQDEDETHYSNRGHAVCPH